MELCKNCSKNERMKNRSMCKSCYYKKYHKTQHRENYLVNWRKHNKEYHKEWRYDNHYSVYLLPNEHYVGQSNQLKQRLSQHKVDGRDTSDYKILHTFSTRKEALAKEAEYHQAGYNG